MLESKSYEVQEYAGSLRFDRRLYRHDIAGSIAHARMLARQGIVSDADAALIVQGLETIRDEIDRGDFIFDPADEDIHMAVEARLFKLVGEVAGKLHTGRSRNDQIALDVRMYLRDEIADVRRLLHNLRNAVVELAERYPDAVMAGYTHLQQAQPVLFAHHLLAYYEMFTRDDERLADCVKRVNVMPLGSGALAGVPYPIDRESVARELGFDLLSTNSIDAVADRDFVAEFNACGAILLMHISRLAEELVLWSSTEFGFIRIGDGFTTGSSIMPQKRNPDLAELARAKTGRTYGNLIAILTVLKSLPLSYNRDLQEDKESLFDTVDTVKNTLSICGAMLRTVEADTARMRDAIRDGVLATDIADYLVCKGLPFREAHRISAALSQHARDTGKSLSAISLEEYRRFSPLFGDDILNLSVERSVSARNVPGGTAPTQVRSALNAARHMLNSEARREKSTD